MPCPSFRPFVCDEETIGLCLSVTFLLASKFSSDARFQTSYAVRKHFTSDPTLSATGPHQVLTSLFTKSLHKVYPSLSKEKALIALAHAELVSLYFHCCDGMQTQIFRQNPA